MDFRKVDLSEIRFSPISINPETKDRECVPLYPPYPYETLKIRTPPMDFAYTQPVFSDHEFFDFCSQLADLFITTAVRCSGEWFNISRSLAHCRLSAVPWVNIHVSSVRSVTVDRGKFTALRERGQAIIELAAIIVTAQQFKVQWKLIEFDPIAPISSMISNTSMSFATEIGKELWAHWKTTIDKEIRDTAKAHKLGCVICLGTSKGPAIAAILKYYKEQGFIVDQNGDDIIFRFNLVIE